MKDQLITILEAVRIAQNLLEVGPTHDTLEELRSTLCNEDVLQAARILSFADSPPLASQEDVPFLRDWRHRLHAA